MTTCEKRKAFQHPGHPVLLDLHYTKATQWALPSDLLFLEFKLDNEPTFAKVCAHIDLVDMKRCTARASVHMDTHGPPGQLVIVFPPNQDWGPHRFTATAEQVAYMDWSHTAPEAVERRRATAGET